MRIFRSGEAFFGTSYTDIINKALGTHFALWRRSTVELSEFGAPDIIAWFVYMDGTEHGFDDWHWRNMISDAGEEIREVFVEPSWQRLTERRAEVGFQPYRLAFRLDPLGENDDGFCKFCGAYALTGFYNENLTAVRYTKVADTFDLGVDDKRTFLDRLPLYRTQLSSLRISDRLRRLLYSGGITQVGDLLEIGMNASGETECEIRRLLYECFGIKPAKGDRR